MVKTSERMKAAANGPLGTPDISDYDSRRKHPNLGITLVYMVPGSRHIGEGGRRDHGAIGKSVAVVFGGRLHLVRDFRRHHRPCESFDAGAGRAVPELAVRRPVRGVQDGSIVSEDRNRANNHGRVAAADGSQHPSSSGRRRRRPRRSRSSRVARRRDGVRLVYVEERPSGRRIRRIGGVNPRARRRTASRWNRGLPEEMRRRLQLHGSALPDDISWARSRARAALRKMLSRQGHDAVELRGSGAAPGRRLRPRPRADVRGSVGAGRRHLAARR